MTLNKLVAHRGTGCASMKNGRSCSPVREAESTAGLPPLRRPCDFGWRLTVSSLLPVASRLPLS